MVARRAILLFLLLALPLWAQTGDKVEVSISSDSIAMDEVATLTVKVDGMTNDVDVDLPQTRDSGLQIMPSGRRLNSVYNNGQLSNSSEITFRITALRTGRHLIEPITGTIGGVPFMSRSVRLEVTDFGTGQNSSATAATGGGWAAQPNPWASGGMWPGQPAIPEPREDDVLLEAAVDPPEVYLHQPIFYDLRLMTAVRLLSDPRYNPIAPTGFLRVPFEQQSTEQEVNGRIYSVSSVKTAYFPLTEGEFIFDPTHIQVSPGAFSMPRTLSTDPKSVKVLPLPMEDRPQSFTGAVGQEFEIRANLKDPEIASDGTAELEISVKGDGHLDLVPYPYLPNWANLEKKLGKSPSTTSVENGQIVSRRTYNYRIKPSRPGRYDLSGIALAYFNPLEKRYEVVQAPSMTLTVESAGGSDSSEDGEPGSELEEADRPVTAAGPSSGRLPELPKGPMAVGVLLLLAGAWLARPSSGGGPRWKKGAAKIGRAPRRHKSFAEFLGSLDGIAPGADAGSRQAVLEGKGWTAEQISRLETLRRKAGRAEFGGGGDVASLESLDKELSGLLKEVPR